MPESDGKNINVYFKVRQAHRTVLSESGYLVACAGGAPHKGGLYLELTHGRHAPDEELNGWGFDGPLIGPLDWVHTTYGTDLKIQFESASDEAYFFQEPDYPHPRELTIHEGLLIYGAGFYGDWSAMQVRGKRLRDRITPVLVKQVPKYR